MEHKNNFDLLRLLAAAQVVYIHATGWLELPVNAGFNQIIYNFPGVAIFFVISGFLVSRSWLRPGMTKRIFLDHRVRRIYPALWINLIVIVAMLAFAGSLRTDTPIRLAIWSFFTFATGSDYIGDQVAGAIYNKGFFQYFPSGVLWTIPIELCFYLLVPTIFDKRLKSRTAIRLSVAAWFIGSMIIHFLWARSGHPYGILKFLWIFLFGSSISLYWDYLKVAFVGKAVFWIPAYLLAQAIYPFDFTTATFDNIAMMMFLACAVISFAYSFSSMHGILLGNDISYGLYLWHMPVIWTMRGFGFTGSWIWGCAAIALSTILAFTSWALIERRALQGKIRLSGFVDTADENISAVGNYGSGIILENDSVISEGAGPNKSATKSGR